MSTGDSVDENDDTVHSFNNSLEDLEQHAIELARLATTFDKRDNLKAASYYYQVGRELSLSHLCLTSSISFSPVHLD